MSITVTSDATPDETKAPLSARRIMVALDASEHANRALAEAVRLAKSTSGEIIGIHAYAALLHDRRFRQMEGGMPERYHQEEEMEYQREVHDDLITRGLNIISDSYHDVGEAACQAAELPYGRLSPEGKNYSQIVEALNEGEYDLIALGALGLGGMPGSIIGTVAERVVRRSPIDTLVIRDPERSITYGPVVVGMDGSSRSFAALFIAFDLHRRFGVEVHAVAAYDPYYHYVAFTAISKVLSDEAGKVFRFKEQEQLHEELIDDGLAKIYQSHLDISERLAEEEGVPLRTELLDGKAYHAIQKYLEKVDAGLLLVGKTGIHGDDALDIGGNAENLLRFAPCHVWLTQRTFTPALDLIAEETITWSEEAEALISRAPAFAQGMARTAVLRMAQERGHTYITSGLVREVAAKMMPGGDKLGEDTAGAEGTAEGVKVRRALRWDEAAVALIDAIDDAAAARNVRLRAEKAARRQGDGRVTADHVRKFLENVAPGEEALDWSAAALARLARVPEMMRDATRQRIEAVARQQGASEIDLEVVEAGLVEARKAMAEAMSKGGHKLAGEGED
ncbi:MAG: universal stress protein [Alphaproteobacteria bacterium]|jgi:nucleotide-binding universal stress UspA family protein|nr:universal stress protein [Alphaproteobacteria bacterium]